MLPPLLPPLLPSSDPLRSVPPPEPLEPLDPLLLLFDESPASVPSALLAARPPLLRALEPLDERVLSAVQLQPLSLCGPAHRREAT